jgi:hypothetical protein
VKLLAHTAAWRMYCVVLARNLDRRIEAGPERRPDWPRVPEWHLPYPDRWCVVLAPALSP